MKKNIGCGFWVIFLVTLFTLKAVIRIGIYNILQFFGWLIYSGLIAVFIYVVFIRIFIINNRD